MWAHERDQDRGLVAHARQLVAKRRHDRAGEAARARGADARKAVGEGALADDRGDGAIAGGGLDHVTASERGAPQRDPLAVDPVEAARIGDRRRPVGELAFDVEQLARLAAAVAEVPVGERERGDPRVREPASVRLEPELPSRAEAVSEDHERRPLGVGHEQPAAALVAGRGEGDVESGAWSRVHEMAAAPGHSRHAPRKSRASPTNSRWY